MVEQMEDWGLVARCWQAMLDAWPYSERLLFTVGTAVTLELTTLIYSLFFVMLERRKWCQSWRIQPNPALSSPPKELVDEAFKDHLLNAIVLRPIFAYFAYPVIEWCQMPYDTASLPSMGTAVVQVFIFMVIDDTWFYWGHRLLHDVPWLYRTIHKKHHRFRFTHVLASEFAHPVEDVLCNTLATILGPLLLGSHWILFWFYGFLKLSQTIEAHSGYVVPGPLSPWCLSPELAGELGRHEFHHSHNKGNYGGFFNWWDRLCGTDKKYNEWIAAGKPPFKELVASE